MGRDAEVEIGLRAGDGGAEVVVGVPYLDGGGGRQLSLNLFAVVASNTVWRSHPRDIQ